MFVTIKIPHSTKYLGSVKEGLMVSALFGSKENKDIFELEKVDSSLGRVFVPTKDKSMALTAIGYNDETTPGINNTFEKIQNSKLTDYPKYKLVYELFKDEMAKENQILNIEPVAGSKFYKIYFGHLCATIEKDFTVQFKKCSEKEDPTQSFEIKMELSPEDSGQESLQKVVKDVENP